MANALFTNLADLMLGSDTAAHTLPDFDTDNFKVVCVDHADDTPAPTTDQDLADIASAARVATSGNLANGSVSSGAIDFDDVTLSAVSGDQFESLVVYQDTGTASSSPLCVYYDTATGLPFTPSGGDITITWSASGLFSLV